MNHCISRLSRAVLLALPLAGRPARPRRGRSQERHLLPGRRHGSGHRDRRPHLQGRKAACRPARLAGQPGARQPFHAAAALRRPHQDLFAGWPDHRQRPVHGRLHDRREDAQRGHFHVGRHGGRGRRGQAIRLGRRQHLPPTNGTPAQTLLELAKAGPRGRRRVDHARRPRHAGHHLCPRVQPQRLQHHRRTIDAGPCELQHPAWRRHRRAAGRRTAQLPARRSTRPASAPTASIW